MNRKVNPLSQSFIRLTLSGWFFTVAVQLPEAYAAADNTPTPSLGYRIVAQYHHDTERFTEGLEIDHGQLFESAGRYGESSIYINDLRNGKLVAVRKLPASVFGEGLTILNNQLFLLTWKEGFGLVLDRQLIEHRRFALPREGWGMTHLPTPAGKRLLMSDGSSTLFEFDPIAMRQTRTIDVLDRGSPVEKLNELEYAQENIYANVWLTDRIAVISPTDGQVRAWIDLQDLKLKMEKPAGWSTIEHVLNGIAYDPESQHFFVTGKCWPRLFELKIDVVPTSGKGEVRSTLPP